MKCVFKQYAWKSIELGEIQSELIRIKGNIKDNLGRKSKKECFSDKFEEPVRKKGYLKFKRSDIFKMPKTYVEPVNPEDVTAITQTEENMLTCESMSTLLDSRAEEKKQAEGNVEVIESLSSREKQLIKELKKMQRKELNRISREFLYNDYERRFKVSRKVVISALAGTENTTNEVIRQEREVKVPT